MRLTCCFRQRSARSPRTRRFHPNIITYPTSTFAMKLFTLLSTTAVTSAARTGSSGSSSTIDKLPPAAPFHRELSGDVISYDDDFWAYNADVDVSSQTIWTNYNFKPNKCMVYNKKHVVAFELYKPNNNSCKKKLEGTYIMEVGKFARAYVAQKEQDYKLYGKDYGDITGLDYVDCTEVYYNDNQYYAKLGCATTGGLRILSYSDSSCTNEISTNLGLYNDIKISFNTCQPCLTWPSTSNNDDGNGDLDDQFEFYHQYDSKMCSAAQHYKQSCGWGCKKKARVQSSSSSYSSSGQAKHYWNGFEKFFLFFWSFFAVGLTWIVLKQRRHMSREDAIVEEAAMQGVGLKKRHIFPIALGIIFFIIFAMFMVWKKVTWLLLIGANFGLFAHFMYLRRKAKRANAGMQAYVKDGGLEIS
ncbi:hypothetical protein HJC23_005137 [Cyclotella cryptica]|uniref:Uncharacterized protein n=1 Tax=Cyclotella cryptica TaxID=29204 RepID=A0ABD3QEY6_9STRA